MELTIAAAIGALTATFFGALITLILIYNRSRRKLNWARLEHNMEIKQNKKFKILEHELAFCDIGLENNLENYNQEWVGDISGVIPHCLLILRTCHGLTKILAKLTMTKKLIIRQKAATCLIEATKRIPSRIDDVLQIMYSSSDSSLLNIRIEALILALGQLASLTKASVGVNNRWIDQSLHEMEQLLTILKTFKKYT